MFLLNGYQYILSKNGQSNSYSFKITPFFFYAFPEERVHLFRTERVDRFLKAFDICLDVHQLNGLGVLVLMQI